VPLVKRQRSNIINRSFEPDGPASSGAHALFRSLQQQRTHAGSPRIWAHIDCDDVSRCRTMRNDESLKFPFVIHGNQCERSSMPDELSQLLL